MPADYSSPWGRARSAVRSGYDTARRVWASPENNRVVPVGSRTEYLHRMWGYYSNSIFNGFLEEWKEYREAYGLYRFHRSIYNPTQRLVEFYAAETWPGVLTNDGKPLPKGIPSAVPFASDMPRPVLLAASQFLKWSNFQSMKAIIPRYAAALGSTFVELEDDLERRKVTAHNWWVGHLAGLTLDATGNVKAYALEYEVAELGPNDVPTGDRYTYRKEVDRNVIRTLKDGEIWDYVTDTADGAFGEVQNPYGFAPAVLFKHIDMGDDFGLPAMWASLDKLDELNELASLGHDQLAKIIKAPVVYSSEGGSVPLSKPAPADALNTNKLKDRERIRIMDVPPGSSLSALPLSMSETLQWLAGILTELENDHPELSMYQKLAQMSQVTGPAADRLLGNVSKRATAIAAAHDLQLVKLIEMAVAMCGYRLNAGHWGKPGDLTAAQLRFKPFGLDSYAAGALAVEITPRELLPETESEHWATEQAKANALTAKKGYGVPDSQLQLEDGYEDKQITAFGEAAAASAEAFGASLLSTGGAMSPGAVADNAAASSGPPTPPPGAAATASSARNGSSNGVPPAAGGA